jgi:hypothetical protein
MQLDVRGPRFAAGITSVVLVLVLITGSPWLALAQAAVFAITVVRPAVGPYGLIFRYLVRPRLGPAREFEPVAPFRFAQGVGLAFAAVATVALFAGATVVGLVAAGLALVAAFLNAAFGLCLGCEAYLLLRRLTAKAV